MGFFQLSHLLWSVDNSPDKHAVFLVAIEFAVGETFVSFSSAKGVCVWNVTLWKPGSNVRRIFSLLLLALAGQHLRK